MSTRVNIHVDANVYTVIGEHIGALARLWLDNDTAVIVPATSKGSAWLRKQATEAEELADAIDARLAEQTPTFEQILADPNEQFDRRYELLASIDAYGKATPKAAEGVSRLAKPEPTCYCDADLVAPHPFSECPHRQAESTAGETRDVPTPGAAT